MNWDPAEALLTLQLTEDWQCICKCRVPDHWVSLFLIDQTLSLLSCFLKESQLFILPVFEDALLIEYELFVFIVWCSDLVQGEYAPDFIDIIDDTILLKPFFLSHFSQFDDVYGRYHVASLL